MVYLIHPGIVVIAVAVFENVTGQMLQKIIMDRPIGYITKRCYGKTGDARASAASLLEPKVATARQTLGPVVFVAEPYSGHHKVKR